METDENSESASNLPAAETGKERETKVKRKVAKHAIIDWQKIIVIAIVVAVLGFIASYSAMTGNASLCITTAPAEKTQQTIIEKEPYVLYKEVDVPYNYIITYELAGSNFYDWLYRKFGKVEIKNTDEHSGIFTVVGKFLLDGKEEKQILSYDISSEKTKLFYFEYFNKYNDTNNANFTYEIIPPSKKVQKQTTEYRDVEKTKQIETSPHLSCLF